METVDTDNVESEYTCNKNEIVCKIYFIGLLEINYQFIFILK